MVVNSTGEERRLLAVLSGMACVSGGLLIRQVISPQELSVLGVTVDRLSAMLTMLVAAIGAVTFSYSIRYLSGDPIRPRFLRLLAFTVVSAYVLMAATNLVLLFGAWMFTSLGLHSLLTIYGDRPEAKRPARKKFLISRLGDIALISAIALIWRDWGTVDLNDFLDKVQATGGIDTLGPIAFLVALAALTKSAQFPFHSWLPETMEAPTPVSALMHAGIINAGGALLLRFAPVIARSPEVMLMLAIVGSLTFALGTLAMWAQTKVKRTLAWSTVSQMGFMMVQCGLGAFPAAALHIVGHGCYKAWSFLRSGELPSPSRGLPDPSRAILLGVIGTLCAVPAIMAASVATGFSPIHSPGEMGLAAIVALAIGQIWVAILGHPAPDARRGVLRVSGTMGGSLAASFLAFALYRIASEFLSPVLGEFPTSQGWLAWLAASIPVLTLLSLLILQQLLPSLSRSPAGRAFRAHALHGFYLGVIADRIVETVWTSPNHLNKGHSHA